MKVQYQLVDIETGKAIPIDEVFEIVDYMKPNFDKGDTISWHVAAVLFGDPFAIKPQGVIVGESPIEEWLSHEIKEASEKDLRENPIYARGSGIKRNGGHFTGDGKTFVGTEATESKGGVNEKPTAPPPKEPPNGQGDTLLGFPIVESDDLLCPVEIKFGDFSEITISIPNTGGEMRSFTVKMPVGARFVRPLWEYDDNGEPINVRLVEVRAEVAV